MTSALSHPHRLALIEAAKALASGATAEARAAEPGSPRSHFFHGVEVAALHVLFPEMASVREGTAWLEREAPAFRDGFTEASTLLATASTGPDPALRLPLPQPSARPLAANG